MSHTARIKGIKISSIEALRSTVAELNDQGIKCSIVLNAAPRAFYQSQEGLGTTDYVIQLADSRYDIGLYKQNDGSYEPRCDFWANDISKLLGVLPVDSSPARTEQAKLGKLFQTYAIHAASEQAFNQGYMTERITNEDGTVQLIVSGFN